jgi:hypothetical protein
MARITIPVVEVTAPDNTKSFWAVYSVPHDEAVAVVTDKLPPNYIAELSVRRITTDWKFAGARPGDVINLGEDPNSERLHFMSAAAGPLRQTEIDELAAQLVARVRRLPPGKQRREALRDIGRLRIEMQALLRSFGNLR